MRSESIALYTPDRSPCRIDLSDNTNAWGMPPASMKALRDIADISRYPSPYADELKAAISDYVGLPESMITTGCGSDDVLDAAIRVLGKPGDRLALTAPDFPMIPTFATLNGLTPIVAQFDDLARSGAAVIYLSSPNNPTGALVARQRIELLLERTNPGQTVIVDEAYAEFAEASVVDLIRKYERLVVTRTLSKAFGLAGIRVGYALGAPALIGAIEKSRGPFKVSAIAERIAVAALTEGLPWMREHAELAVAMRGRLVAELRRRGFDPMESAANFVFIQIPDAVEVGREMARRGIRVRSVNAPSGVRVSVAPWPALVQAIDALEEACRQCA